MNIASKELCEELFRLSGWHNTDFVWTKRVIGRTKPNGEKYTAWTVVRYSKATEHVPAYDHGYLQDRLPQGYVVFRASSGMYRSGTIKYDKASEQLIVEPFLWAQYDEVASAACHLAIHLIKEGLIDVGEK